MFEKIVDVFSEYTVFPKENMSEETQLVDDLELNSFDVMTIIRDVEDEYKISIPDEDIINFKTIGDIKNYLESHT